MPLKFISERLIEKEIKRLESQGRSEVNEFLCCQYKKELAVIKKLKINEINMCGETEEFNERLSRNAVYFLEPRKFEEMKKKANLYDAIEKIVDRMKTDGEKI